MVLHPKMLLRNNARNSSGNANNRQKNAVKGHNRHGHKRASKRTTAIDIVAITNEEEARRRIPNSKNKNSKPMERLVKGALVALAVALVSACSMDTVYHRYSHTSVSGWEKNDTLKFYVPRLHQGGVFAQQLDVRINGAYPFTAATLIVKQRIVPGNQELTDTINCTFSKPDGTRLSRGISYYQYSYPIAKHDLREGDSLVVSVYHDMKRDMLPGISDVGIHISRVSYLHNALYK